MHPVRAVRVVPEAFVDRRYGGRAAARAAEPGCASGSTSDSSASTADGAARDRRRQPSRPGSTRSTSWTTSARSRRSAGRGTTFSSRTRRSPGSPPVPNGCGWARSSPASRTATSPTSGRSCPHWTCSAAAGRSAGSGSPGSSRSIRRTGGRSRPHGERYALLEDALRLLPAVVGQGQPALRGTRSSPCRRRCAIRGRCRPHVPIVLGGSGERRTLKLAGEYADAANVFGDLPTVRRKKRVLR